MKLIACLLALYLLLTACSDKKVNYDDVADYKRAIFHLYTNPAVATIDTKQVAVRLKVYLVPSDSSAHQLIWDTTLAQRRLTAYGTLDAPFEINRVFNRVYDSRQQIRATATTIRQIAGSSTKTATGLTIPNHLSITVQVPL